MPANDSDRLAALALALARDDPRFAKAIGTGRPRLPREYRRRRTWLSVLLLGAVAVFVVSIATGRIYLVLAAISLAVGSLTLTWPDWPDRPGRRRRGRFRWPIRRRRNDHPA